MMLCKNFSGGAKGVVEHSLCKYYFRFIATSTVECGTGGVIESVIWNVSILASSSQLVPNITVSCKSAFNC
jgi:hypothetical protein